MVGEGGGEVGGDGLRAVFGGVEGDGEGLGGDGEGWVWCSVGLVGGGIIGGGMVLI